MKYLLLILLVVLVTPLFSQDFEKGIWKGKIISQDTFINVELTIFRKGHSIVSAMMSKPVYMNLEDSCFNGYELNLKVSKEKLSIRNENLIKKEKNQQKKSILYNDAKFTGSLADNKNQLNGELTLDDDVFPVTLFRDSIPIYRPQEPKRPYPYYCEDVVCINSKDSTILAGTLTLPKKEGNYPVVIFQTGSAPTSRDGAGNYHKFNLVIADYLTRNGIGVLRYDSRGIGKSKGNFYKSTPLDLSGDLIAWKEFLASREDINDNEIGLIGHSEGGMVAAMAASQSNDFAFIVMLGTPGLMLRDVFEKQTRLKFEDGQMTRELYEITQNIDHKTIDLLDQNLDRKSINDSLLRYKEEVLKIFIDTNINTFQIQRIDAAVQILFSLKTSLHNLFNLKVNPADYLVKVTCPVLCVGGSLDRHVPTKDNQEAIRQALIKGGNQNYKLIELDGINHFFQECEKGTTTEAMKIAQTFSPKALEIITNWILSQTINE